MSCSFRLIFSLFVLRRWSTRAAWVTWPGAAYHVSASWAACGRAGVRPPASSWIADPRRSFSTAASSSPAVGQPTAPRFATLAARTTTFPAIKYAGKDIGDGNNVKNERTNVPISFWKQNQNVLVSFPNLSCWEQIVSIWSRICSPGPNRNDLFRWSRFGNELTDVLVSFLLNVGWWNVCSFTVLTLLLMLTLGKHIGVECSHQLCKWHGLAIPFMQWQWDHGICSLPLAITTCLGGRKLYAETAIFSKCLVWE